MRTHARNHRRPFPIRLLSAMLWGAAGTLQAGEQGSELATPAAGQFVAASYGAGGYLAQLIGGLAFVVIAILVLAWLMRRFSGTSGTHIPRAIEILAVRSVGTRERLMLVQVGDEQVLIGVFPTGMRTLHRLKHPVQSASLSAPTRATTTAPPTTASPQPPQDPAAKKFGVDFASLLRKQMSKTEDA